MSDMMLSYYGNTLVEVWRYEDQTTEDLRTCDDTGRH